MKPKSIIIKSNTNILIKQLVNELKEYPNIRYINKMINGENTLVVKCFNYYQKNKLENDKNFYGNYTYLYTCLSLLLTDLIMDHYETIFINRILHYNYFYYGKNKIKKIFNVTNLILSPCSPIENSYELLMYRKQFILADLLKNFHRRNYLHLDAFINFSLQLYKSFLEEIIDNIIQLAITNMISIEHLNLVIKNMFDY